MSNSLWLRLCFGLGSGRARYELHRLHFGAGVLRAASTQKIDRFLRPYGVKPGSCPVFWQAFNVDIARAGHW